MPIIGLDDIAGGGNSTEGSSSQDYMSLAATIRTAEANETATLAGVYTPVDATSRTVNVRLWDITGQLVTNPDGATLVDEYTMVLGNNPGTWTTLVINTPLTEGRVYAAGLGVFTGGSMFYFRLSGVNGDASRSLVQPAAIPWEGSTYSQQYMAYVETTITPAGGPSDSRPITLSPPANTISIQTMIADAVTTAGSVFDVAMIAVEDNMQATIPAQIALSVGFADLTMTADGVYNITFSGGGSEEEFNIPVTYYSPDNKQMSFAEITVFEAPSPFLVQDTFTDVESTHLTNHSPDVDDVGNGWVEYLATTPTSGANTQILSNKGGTVTDASEYMCLIDSGTSDVTISVVTNATNNNGSGGIVARAVHAESYWLFDANSGNAKIRIFEVNPSFVDRASTNIALSEFVDWTLEVVISGTNMTLTHDGINPTSYNSATYNQTETKHGIRFTGAGGNTDQVFFDDFTIT